MALLYFLLAVIVVIPVYFFVIRPWQLTWGATKAEVPEHWVGDGIVQKPHFVATRAIDIAAPPAEVWKWIVQT